MVCALLAQSALWNIVNIISLVSLIFTVIALSFSLWQTWESKKQTSRLQGIEASLSTRYLGDFPDFVPAIAKILGDAEREIRIACDLVGYCSITDYRRWRAYEDAIRKVLDKKGMDVEMYTLDKDGKGQLLRHQFTANKSGRNLERDNELQQINEYLQRATNKGITEGCPAIDQLINAFLHEEDLILAREFRSLKTKTVPRMPIYFWVVDGKEAVFSVPSYSAIPREQGFITNDPKLITALTEIYSNFGDDRKIDSSETAPIGSSVKVGSAETKFAGHVAEIDSVKRG